MIETVLTVFIGILIVLLLAGGYYLIKVYPGLLKKRIYAGKIARTRATDKIEKLLDGEVTNLMINENPELLEMFSKSTDLAIETNNVPAWVGMVMGKALPFLASFISTSDKVAANPTLAMAADQAGSIAGSPAVINTLLDIFAGVFKARREREPKPKTKKHEPKTKQLVSKADFPEFA